MSPLRWDVLLVGFVLALPLIALGMRGDLTTDEVMTRLPWCLLAGWGVVALLRAAGTPRAPKPSGKAARKPVGEPVGAGVDDSTSPAI